MDNKGKKVLLLNVIKPPSPDEYFYSLIETVKLNNINPWLYLRQVLATIQNHNSTKLAELLPWNIKLE